MRVIETSDQEDLAAFSRFLWQQRVPHRIFEERGRQVLEVAHEQHAEAVHAAYSAWQRGELKLDRLQQPPGGTVHPLRGWQGVWHRIRRFPALSALIAAAVLVYPFSAPVAEGRLTEVAGWLTIVDIGSGQQNQHWQEVFGIQAWWRLLTPVLLHFSVVHLLFNCAVMIEFGRRVEAARGSGGLLLLVAVIGMVSNLAQFWMSGNPLFGGLSGVAYGVLGFLLVSARRFPEEAHWRMPNGIAVSLLLFLVLFTTGITESFGLYVANTAHWSGLACGLTLALLWPGIRRNSEEGTQP